MNRNNEYFELLEKLDSIEAPQDTVRRAIKKKRRNSLITKPLVSIAVFFLAFVLLVNVSPTVAKALEDVPVIGGITRAVTFTRGTRGAVENGYQQPLDMCASDGDCAIGLRYLIADEKNVSFTFELTGDLPERFLPECTYGSGDDVVKLGCDANKNNTVLTASTRYVDHSSYPDSGTLTIKLYEMIIPSDNELVFTEDGGIVSTVQVDQPTEPFAQFSFDITVDKSLIGEAKHYEPNTEFLIKGQRLIIKSVDIYPICAEITIDQDESNNAWVNDLDFNVRDDAGDVYLYSYVSRDAMSGSKDTRNSSSCVYYTESPYFSDTENITLVAFSCSFLEKAAMEAEIDLTTGELAKPSDCIKVIKTEKNGNEVYAKFMIPINSQFDEKKYVGVGEFTCKDNVALKGLQNVEFRSDSFTNDKLELDFYFTGSYFSRDEGEELYSVTVPLK